MSEKVYLFTYQEFTLLLAAAGVHSLYGFQFEMEAPGRETALQLLQGLNRKGYLAPSGEEFELTGEMKKIFGQFKTAKTILETRKASGRTCLFYLGEVCVRLSKSLRRPDTLELQELAVEKVWEWMKEEGWISEGRRDDDTCGNLCAGSEPAI